MATPLFPLMQKLIHDEWVILEGRQITPWASFNSHFGTICVDFHGSAIGSGGFEFSGSIRARFWNRYIEPFLEDLTCRAFEHVRRLAAERHQNLRPALEETAGLLTATVRKAYARMAEIDQRLRGKGDPSSVPRYSPDAELAAMEGFITRHLKAELATLGGLRRLEEFQKRHPLLFRMAGAAVLIALTAMITWALIPSEEGKLRGVELLEHVAL